MAPPDMPGGMGQAWRDPGMLHAGVPILFWRPGVTVMTSPADTSAYRSEKDSFGPIDVPAGRLWGAQTQRSLQHFAISVERRAPELIRALARVKRASACVNHALGLLDAAKTRALVAAADEGGAGGPWRGVPPRGWGGGGDRRRPLAGVPARGLADRLGHADQHEHERGAGQPRQRVARRPARPGAAGAPERRGEPEPVEQ